MNHKSWAFTLYSLSLSTTILFADQASDGMQKMPQPLGVTTQPKEVITPPVAPTVNNGADFFIETDFIYWNGFEEALGIASSSNAATVTAGQNIGQGQTYAISGAWQPGFKLGFGLEMEHDGWDIFANWTWISPFSINASGNDDDIGLRQLQPRETAKVAPISAYQGSLQLHFNSIDLELGRNFFLSKYLTLRPYIGLKTAWINQDFNRTYTLVTDVVGSDIYKSNQGQDSWAIGIRAGCSPVFHIAKNWGIYGNLTLNNLYGYYKISDYEFYVDPSENVTSDIESNYISVRRLTTVIELGLGLEYMTWFCNDSYMLHVKAGWEEQAWLNVNNFFYAGNDGDLMLQGFTFNVGFHF